MYRNKILYSSAIKVDVLVRTSHVWKIENPSTIHLVVITNYARTYEEEDGGVGGVYENRTKACVEGG